MTKDRPIISASELANYVVCPEAWRLKHEGLGQKQQSARTTESKERKQEWVRQHDLSSTLREYAKIVYFLLLLVVIVVFLLDSQRESNKHKQAPPPTKSSVEATG